MNMHSIAKTPFDKLNHQIAKAYEVSATKNMQRAAEEYRDNTTLEPTKRREKFDEAWQKRGHASSNGYVSEVVGDKCADVEALSKFCTVNKMWKKKKGSPDYIAWEAKHNCHVKYVKSSGAMESVGAVAMFKRPLEKNNLIYSKYLLRRL